MIKITLCKNNEEENKISMLELNNWNLRMNTAYSNKQ